MLIGLSGLAGCGKSTVAEYLASSRRFERIRFADPLKNMLRVLGLSDEHIEGRLKELPCDILGGRSPRHAMITIGTEWGRDLIYPNLWVDAWGRDADRALACGENVAAEDCRFENEAAAIHARGGLILRIERPNAATPKIKHASEAGVEADLVIVNDGTVEQLYAAIDMALGFGKQDIAA